MPERSLSKNTFDLNDVKSYLKYTGVAIRKSSHDNTMYYGCIFNYSTFNDLEMISDDIIGCLYKDCTLKKLDLSNTDFSTNKLVETMLNEVAFDGATITNCDFGKCVFKTCTFNHIALSNTVFRKCKFINIDLTLTTTCNNQFIECEFIKCNLKNSVNYNVFCNCKFTDVNIDVNVFVSNIFDIMEKNNIPYIIDGNPDEIKQRLKDTSQYIHYTICRFNMASMPLEATFLASIMSIQNCCSNNLIVRVEQITFIDTLLKYSIATNNYISALTLFQCLDILEPLLSEKANLLENYVQSVCIAIKQLFLDCCEQYAKYTSKVNYNKIETEKEKLYLNITYEHKPQSDLTTLLNTIANYTNMEGARANCILGEYACYHEIIEFTFQMLPVIETLAALVGLLVPFTIERMKEKRQQEKSRDNVSLENNNINNYTIYNIIQVNNYNNIDNSNNINSIANALIKNNVTCENNYCGYNKNNIRTIIVQDEFHSDK